MSIPETCPFCGAEPYTTASGEQCRGGDRWVLFSCDTSIYAGQDARRMQSLTCAGLERKRLDVRLAELEAENKALKERIAALRDRLAAMESDSLRDRENEHWARDSAVEIHATKASESFGPTAWSVRLGGVRTLEVEDVTIHHAIHGLRAKVEGGGK